MSGAALLDANVLIALVVADHVHHDAAERWLSESEADGFATCPVTEGSLLRLLLPGGIDPSTARAVLHDVHQDARHEFWADDLTYLDVRLEGCSATGRSPMPI